MKTIIFCALPNLLAGKKLPLLVLLAFFFHAAPALTAGSGEVSPTKPAEYMIYQYPGVALLIRIDAAETEFEARVYGPDRALIKASHVPMRRIGPVYQFIDAVETARQLIVEVTPAYTMDRSRISMELVQLAGDKRTSALEAEAFRLMSRAMDITSANDSSTWAMKSYTFRSTANAFQQLGWEELRLWSEYYAAHLVFFKLADALSAIELARNVQLAARRAGFKEIEMAALQLEGAAWLETREVKPGLSVAQKFTETHKVLGRAAVLADELGFDSERALALYNDGLAWEREENLSQAVVQYRLALDLAVSANDTELANRIRNQAAFAYESQGSVSGAIEMLDQIGDELSEDEVALELADSLYDKGRILFNSYRYGEATGALSEAYTLQESAGSSSRKGMTGLVWGQALYGLGQMSRAAEILQDSVTRISSSGNEQELFNTLRTLSAIYRMEGNFTAMANSRDEQAKFIRNDSQRAEYMFDSAQDRFARSGKSSNDTQSLLRQSRQLATRSGDQVLAHRALLQYCAQLKGELATRNECSQAQIGQAYEFLLAAGIPRYTLEARFAQSRILRAQGRLTQAVSAMSHLLEEIRYYRQVLPGVLGGWYWESREHIFDQYMSMVLQQSTAAGGTPADGSLVLNALEQLRLIDTGDSRENFQFSGSSGQEGAENIRSMLMIREEKLDQSGKLGPDSRINAALDRGKEGFIAANPRLSMANQKSMLGNLPRNSALLTYYFAGSNAYAIVAKNERVQLFRIGRSRDVPNQIMKIREDLGNEVIVDDQRLNDLGKHLLRPLAHLLPEKIYFLPGGPLSGFPLDILRLDGRYLAQQNELVNLMSISALANPVVRIDPSEVGLSFLAGDPQGKRDVFDYDQNMSEEVRAVTDIFVGPGLHIVQGSSLRRDEFQDERFEQAELIHLAIPGMIRLDYPQRSVLMLSARPEQTASDALNPKDIGGRRFNASLAILSATGIRGSNDSGFGNYLGFVTDFLLSGVDAVVAGLWLLDDSDRAQFMTAFYTRLMENPDVAQALTTTRRDFLSSEDGGDIRIWAVFQIYLN